MLKRANQFFLDVSGRTLRKATWKFIDFDKEVATGGVLVNSEDYWMMGPRCSWVLSLLKKIGYEEEVRLEVGHARVARYTSVFARKIRICGKPLDRENR